MTDQGENSIKNVSLTLHQLNSEHCLQDVISTTESLIRSNPLQSEHRWTLVELLCLVGDWERAMRQLQTVAQMDGSSSARAHLIRGLIRAESQRTQVFMGNLEPAPVIDMPSWALNMSKAIALNVAGNNEAADVLRQNAMEEAAVVSGVCVTAGAQQNLQTQDFEWLSDSDSRLGPICEVMLAGGYRWLPFADIETLKLDAPKHLFDLLWTPVTLTLRGTKVDGKLIHGFLPVRYCGTEIKNVGMHDLQRDALLLSRMTRWRDVGQTGVFASGQKTLISDVGDFGVLDVREIRMRSEVSGE
jgi:type VI secretion system protein ImpE